MICEEEVWKPIIGYEGTHEVSNYGRVKSIGRKWDCGLGWEVGIKTKIIKGTKNNVGYMMLHAKKGGKYKLTLIHRHVAAAFIPNPENKPNVNHKNGIKHDNRVDNLEWCTQSENVLHSYKNGFQIPRNMKDNNPRSKSVVCIEKGIYFQSVGEASRIMKLRSAHIATVCRGERKSTGGFTFKYV